MAKVRWRKLLRDLSINKTRTIFVILAIFIGVFGISVVANSYSILEREMDKNYMNTTPASASLLTTTIDKETLEKIAALPYIDTAELRLKAEGRVQVGDNSWKDIWLFVVNDFNALSLDTFSAEEGKAVPDKGEILFERKALSLAKAQLGQSINIKIPNNKAQNLKLSGTVHAPGLAPSWMEGFAYGFITKDTYELLGGASNTTELKILVSENTMNKQHIKDCVYNLKDFLEANNVKVVHIEIPTPGRHPHYTQMAALLFLMEIFGLLALVLSGVLVANIISAILEQQTRQIGIMKAIGASTKQIALLYTFMVLLLSTVAMALALPLGIYAGRGYASVAAGLLNFNIYNDTTPPVIILLEVVVGLLVPILTAAYPISKGSRITVREAITDYGISQQKYTGKSSTKSFKMPKFIPRPLLLSLRNTFRRRGRFLFTMLVMAVGGTGFIVAMNIYASMYNTVEDKINSIFYDIQVTFDSPQQGQKIIETAANLPDVSKIEAWGGIGGTRVYTDGTQGNFFGIIAPPSDTELMAAPPLYEGRWLDKNDTNALVINQRLLSTEPDIKVGDEITLNINQNDSIWKVIGISKELIGQPCAYTNSEYLSKLIGKQGIASGAVVVTKNRDLKSQEKVAEIIEKTFADNGLSVKSLIKIDDYRISIENHLLIIATFLIIMSLLVVLVGGLGLATTISINAMERTREIGIMRTVGASTHSLTGIIVSEGIIVGLISWFVSLILAWPLSSFVSYNFGMIFFEAPLEFKASGLGFVIWLLIVMAFAALASFYPSRKATQIPVRNALSYE